MPSDRRIPGLTRFLRLPDRPVENDVAEELAFHIESRVHDLLRAGVRLADAQRIAEQEFGDLNAARRELAAVDRHRRRRERLSHLFETLVQDLRYAVRSLSRARAFTVTALVTIVCGVGAIVAIFAIIDAVLIRPLPFPNADQLVGAWHDMRPIGLYHAQQSAATYLTYRSQARAISEIGIYSEGAVNVGDERSTNAPARVTSATTTATLFRVLGVSAAHGRVFGAADDVPGAQAVMVISDGMWRDRFGGDPATIGRRLEVDGVRREIVGVMPANFRFPSAATEIWLPFQLDPAHLPATAFAYNGVARLNAGVTMPQAQRDFAAVLPRVIDLYPKFVPGITTRAIMDQTKPEPVLTPLLDDITGSIARTLWMMGGAAALLFLVACVNVATLTLVRFDARQRELAVRVALGAGRMRVIRHQFAESSMLAGLGTVLGLGVAWVIVRLLVSHGDANIPRLTEIGLGWRTMLFALGVAIMAAVLCSVIPALRIGRGTVLLRDGARGSTASRRQQYVRNALVIAQMAFALVVLAASGLLVRSFLAMRAVRSGFEADNVATLWLSLPRARYAQNSDVIQFYARLVTLVSTLPNVKSVGLTSRLPLATRGANPNPLYPENAPAWDAKLPPLQLFTTVGGDYFRTLHIPLIAGRGFDAPDRQREGEAVVSRRTATLFWRDSTGHSALGKRFRDLPGGRWYTVIGVAADVRDTALAAPPSPTVYLPELVTKDSITRYKARSMALVIRMKGDPSAIFQAVRRSVRDLDPMLPTFDARPMSALIGASTARLAFTTLILGGAAAMTVILGAVGLYGVLAYLVTLRRRELGIRIALGASPGHVTRTTARHGLMLAGLGAIAGLALLSLSLRSIRGVLFGVTPWDPPTIAGSTLLLLVIAALASWIPARRAGRVDPSEALRAD